MERPEQQQRFTIGDLYTARHKQLDAILWDTEYERQVRLLIDKIGLYGGAEHDVELLTKLFLFTNLIKDHTSVGLKCLGVRYYDGRNETNVADLSKYQTAGLAVAQILVPWLSSRRPFQCSLSQALSFVPSNKLSLMLKLSRVLSFYMFLMQGKYRTLEERFLGIICGPMVPGQRVQRMSDESQYDLMNRELMWKTLAEFLTLVIPHTNFHKIRNSCMRAIGLQPPLDTLSSSPSRFLQQSSALELRSLTDLSKCAICDKIPVAPHEIGCRHVFCYYCVYANYMADTTNGVVCPKCNNLRVTPQSIRRLTISI